MYEQLSQHLCIALCQISQSIIIKTTDISSNSALIEKIECIANEQLDKWLLINCIQELYMEI